MTVNIPIGFSGRRRARCKKAICAGRSWLRYWFRYEVAGPSSKGWMESARFDARPLARRAPRGRPRRLAAMSEGRRARLRPVTLRTRAAADARVQPRARREVLRRPESGRRAARPPRPMDLHPAPGASPRRASAVDAASRRSARAPAPADASRAGSGLQPAARGPESRAATSSHGAKPSRAVRRRAVVARALRAHRPQTRRERRRTRADARLRRRSAGRASAGT